MNKSTEGVIFNKSFSCVESSGEPDAAIQGASGSTRREPPGNRRSGGQALTDIAWPEFQLIRNAFNLKAERDRKNGHRSRNFFHRCPRVVVRGAKCPLSSLAGVASGKAERLPEVLVRARRFGCIENLPVFVIQ